MGQSVRTFIFHTPEDWQQFVAFMREKLAPMAERERYMQAVVSEYRSTRTKEQNAFMWVAILEPMAQQAIVNGVRYKAEAWNELCKELFLPETCAKGVSKWEMLPNGGRRLVMSTTDLNDAEMTVYLHEIAAYAAVDQGVLLPANPRDI